MKRTLLSSLPISTILSAFLLICQFYALAQPTITSFSPTTGDVGTLVTITGSNFNITPSDNIVMFGATRAAVITASATQLTVTVPTGATYAPITMLNSTSRQLAYSGSRFTPTFSPNKGSINEADFSPLMDIWTASGRPFSVAIGDLDGDSKSDLAVANWGLNKVSVFRNTSTELGSITYSSSIDFSTGSDPVAVSIGDLDNDGKADLVVVNRESNSISVFRNTTAGVGNIAFANKVDFTTGQFPHFGVAIGDLDNDGKADIVVSNNQSSSISIFRNTSTRAGSISYAPKVDYGVGTNPISVSIGDLNNDTKADIAVANSFSVSVLRNISTGAGDIAYAAKTDFPTGVAPMSLSMGDCDGDGKEDLVVANRNDNTLSVLRNTATQLGNISFATKVDFNTNSGPWSVSVGDLDGDGKVDLAVTNFDSSNVSVFKNTSMGVGNISYAAKIDYATGSLPYSLSIGDLDGDGKPDLAVGNYGSNTISIIRNNPTFNSPPDITGFMPKSGAIGTSVVITGTSFSTTPTNNIVMFGATAATVSAATSTSLTVTVPSGATYAQISVLNMSTGLLAYSIDRFTPTFFPNKSTITTADFTPRIDFSTDSGLSVIASGDLDGDGKADLCSASQFGLSILRNSSLGVGDISYEPKEDYTFNFFSMAKSISIADLDGDGKSDLVVSYELTTYFFRNTSTGIGDIAFADRVEYSQRSTGLTFIDDFDADGRADLVVENEFENKISILRNISSGVGNIRFSARAVDIPMGTGPFSISVGDLDGDLKPDLAVALYNGNTISVFRNTSTGSGVIRFVDRAEDYDVGLAPTSVSIGDLDGDGKADLAGVNEGSAKVSIFRNTSIGPGSISYSNKLDFTTNTSPSFVSIGDLNGDGKLELVVTNDNSISIFNNTSSGAGNISFSTKVSYATNASLQFVTIGDFDGDGKPELAIPVYEADNISIFRNNVKVSQTITFAALANKTFGDAPFTLSGTSSSGLAPTYTSSNTAVASVSGNTVTIVGAGSTIITASQSGNNNYNPAVDVAQSLTVNKASQTISFAALSNKTFGDASFTLSGTSSSGLVVTYVSSNTAVATVSGNTVTIVGAGTTTITAKQTGNNSYNPAVDVAQSLTVNKASQTITFATLANKTFGDVAFALLGTSSSGLALTYTSSNTAVATVTGNTVTIVGVGTSSITAKQAGNNNYNPAVDVIQSLTVNKASQTITFAALSNKTFGDAPFTLSGTSLSGLALTYTSSNTAVATVSGSTVTIVGAGIATITAKQAGNTNYNPAADVAQSLTVNKASQTITFNALPSNTFGDAPFTLSATSSSGLAPTYTSSNTAVATVSGNTVTIVGAGIASITASQAGNSNYNAGETSRQLTVNKALQTITFTAFANKTFGDAPFTLSGTSSVGLPVTFASNNTAVATISGNKVTIVGAGIATITAMQVGNTNYNPAETSRQLTVSKANQTIAFSPLANKIFGEAPFVLQGNSSSGLPLTYSSSNPSVAIVSGNSAIIVGVGITIITASQLGDGNYNAASSLDQSFTVNKADQSITFVALADKLLSDGSLTLSATASSSLPVSFTSNSDKISIANSTVTLLKAGRVSITASQVGNENYNVASSVTQSFCIKPAKPTVTISNLNTPTPLLTSSASTGNQWYADGTVIAGATSATFSATKSGNYKVQVIVDECIGEFSAEQPLVITGIEAIDFLVDLYPNPVGDVLTIYFGGLADKKQVTIFALTGESLVANNTESSSIAIDVSDLSAGMYLAKVIAGGTVQTKKFKKQ